MKYCLIAIVVFLTYSGTSAQEKEMLVRIAELEIDSRYLEEYKIILREEARSSVELEPGVLSIFPMFRKDNPNQIRILEIYADGEAYQDHLKTPHFLKYKSLTAKMVKSLKLVDMESVDAPALSKIFRKIDD